MVWVFFTDRKVFVYSVFHCNFEYLQVFLEIFFFSTWKYWVNLSFFNLGWELLSDWLQSGKYQFRKRLKREFRLVRRLPNHKVPQSLNKIGTVIKTLILVEIDWDFRVWNFFLLFGDDWFFVVLHVLINGLDLAILWLIDETSLQ